MTTKPRNVWVLGATGYIGQALLRQLSHNPENRVHVLQHRSSNFPQLEPFNTFQGSLNKFDPEWIHRYPADVVFHLARPAGSNYLMREMRSIIGERGNARLAKIFVDASNPPMVIFVSGSLVYGQIASGQMAHEQWQHNPGSFARAYYRNEKPWLAISGKGILDVRFARPAWIVGPGSWYRKYFWDHFVQCGKVPCYGDGSQQMSLVGIDDCATAIIALSTQGQQNQTLNIFSMEAISQMEFSLSMAVLLQTEIELISFSSAKRMHGNTVAKALTMSIPLGTIHQDFYDRLPLQQKTVNSLLAGVIELLKNEKAVLTKTP